MSGRRLTLSEERELIAAMRRLPRPSPGEFERGLRDTYGIAMVDQWRAAAAETRRRVLDLAAALPDRFPHRADATSWEFATLLHAAFLRCAAQSRCEHVAMGGRPVVASLAARVVACERCLPRFRGAIAASAQRIRSGADRLCDLCLEEPANGNYRPIVVPYGPVQLMGDVCDECFAVAETERRAAA
jgi:hypothetical protein